MKEIVELMQLETEPQLKDSLEDYSEWDSLVILGVLALFDDSFGIDASENITECKTFQDVVNLVSDKLH
ncbi:hypothetical protein CXF82_14040 [Shewanella sp. GutDb-MelDb]|nr:hypothetical protein CXF82_14040 [Shewanella sp. GutDb-MelDb]